jgi:hypothetical protein
MSNQLSNNAQRCWYTSTDLSGRVVAGQVGKAEVRATQEFPDKEAVEVVVFDPAWRLVVMVRLLLLAVRSTLAVGR